MKRGLVSTLLFCSFGFAIQAAETPANAFFGKRCTECHDSETKKGNLDLSSLKPDFADAETFTRWVNV